MDFANAGMFLSPLNFGKPVLYTLPFSFYRKKENRARWEKSYRNKYGN